MQLSKFMKDMKKSNVEIEGYECMFCGELSSVGGLWNINTTENKVVCSGCQNQLVEFLIDTLKDTMNFDLLEHGEQLQILTSICNQSLLKKKAHERMLKSLRR